MNPHREPPLVVWLGPRCNNRCIFCPLSSSGADPVTDEEGWLALLRSRLETSVQGPVVVFVGGEPTLHEALPHWSELALRSGASAVWVQTNARRLGYRAYAKRLAQAGVSILDVSLHGSSADMHDYHVSVPGAFAQSCRGIENAKAAGMRVVISCVWTRSNYRHTAEMVRLARRLGVSELRCIFPMVQGRAADFRHRLLLPSELMVPYVQRALETARTARVRLFVDGAVPADGERLWSKLRWSPRQHDGTGFVELFRRPPTEALSGSASQEGPKDG